MARRGAKSDLEARVADAVGPVIEREGYELVDVELATDRGSVALCFYIDTIPPGTAERAIGVEDCSRVSRIVGDILDAEDIVEGAYKLEVSSPGLFRPLTKPAHFARVIGERIKVRTYEKIGDRKVFTGILTKHDDDAVSVDVDGHEFRLAHDQIAKANLEPDLSTRR